MNTNQDSTFDRIVKEALHQGLIDIFRVMYWMSNATPCHMVVQEIADLANQARQAA